MSDTLHSIFLFLVNMIFDLYLFLLAVRMILVWIHADYFSPMTQFILKCTDFLIKPIKKYLPNSGRVEWATLVLLLVIEIVKFICICLLSFGWPSVMGLLILAVGDAFKMFLETFFYAILIQVIISWMHPNSPVYYFLRQITAPVLSPFQRIIPLIAGVDITPIPALILLQVLIIIGQSMMQYGLLTSYGT